jgi:hypothetical protein
MDDWLSPEEAAACTGFPMVDEGEAEFADPDPPSDDFDLLQDTAIDIEADPVTLPPAGPSVGSPSLLTSMPSSSSAPAPLGPVEPVPPIPATGLDRGHAAQLLRLAGGKIAYYERKRSVEVTCDNPMHGKCRITRTLVAGRGATASQGRPMGLAVAWLSKSFHCLTKADHWSDENWPTLAERQAGRRCLQTMGDPAGMALLALEREKLPSEESEPEVA